MITAIIVVISLILLYLLIKKVGGLENLLDWAVIIYRVAIHIPNKIFCRKQDIHSILIRQHSAKHIERFWEFVDKYCEWEWHEGLWGLIRGK